MGLSSDVTSSGVSCPQGLAPEAALEDLVLHQEGPDVEVVKQVGSQGAQGSWQVSRSLSKGSKG